MIRVYRGNEPPSLLEVRNRELPKLRSLASAGKLTSDDIRGYRTVAEALWKAQHCKCCYCEHRILHRHNDVEHYRPKARADRSPGSPEVHGYWWLAFCWENLLYACPSCNEAEKRVRFPLSVGDVPLHAEEEPPGHEHPLLIDPAGATNPAEHIRFHLMSVGPPRAPESTFGPGPPVDPGPPATPGQSAHPRVTESSQPHRIPVQRTEHPGSRELAGVNSVRSSPARNLTGAQYPVPATSEISPQWWAFPRNGSALGAYTIEVCGLNHQEHRELRGLYVEQHVVPQADELKRAVSEGNEENVHRQFQRAIALTAPHAEYVLLSYDALRHFVPDALLAPWKLRWPEPEDVGLR